MTKPINNTNIFFQNGMDNNFEGALKSSKLIENLTNKPIGLIVNNSGGIGGDVLEYLPSTLTLKDALNGEVYQQIANNNNKSLIIMHSAGNEDAIKSAQVLALNNINLNNSIDVISVGSPASFKKLQENLNPVGINVIGQYNNILDPVTNAKTWGVGMVGAGILGGVAGYGIMSSLGGAASTSITNTGLEFLFNSAITLATSAAPAAGAVGAVGAVGKNNIKIQHPFEAYFNKDFKNLSTDVQKWSNENSNF